MLRKYKVRISQHMYAYFKPEVYFFRIFGIFPFTTIKTNTELFFKWSPWYTFYSYTCALLLITSSLTEGIIGMFSKGGVKLDIINNTDTFVWLFTVAVYCVATFIVTFITPKQFRELCDYIKCINQVDELQENSVNLKIGFDYASILLFLDTVVVTASIVITYFTNDNLSRAIFSIITRVVPFALHVLVGNMVQYMIRLLIRILSMKFVCLNEALDHQYQKIKNGKMNDLKPPLNIYAIAQHHPQEGRTGPILFTPNSNDDKIVVLSNVYLKLMEAAKIFNDHFGMTILIVMASSLFQLISTPYHIILSLEGKRRGFAETLRRLIKFSEQLLRILILIEPLYDCSMKMQEVGQQVCNLLSLNIEAQYRKQVDALAMCICLKEMKFTAWGCFDVDRFLLSALVGTITTYVCILLQAQESETA